ncbi:hypothetical protein UB31_18915 [Bradyrhizobium sp. LTSP849]|nr:hypothetical protein UB31_18915 [Bradyrhizobium sp. LTSP849]
MPTLDGRLDNANPERHFALMKLDQGLGIIGLLVLATALALLLTIGIPISVSKDSVELKDWLGFAGNVMGAFVTVVAAAIAWKAVQRQIASQHVATQLGVMTREEDRIEELLPGLRDAVHFASGFLTYRVLRGFDGVVEAFQSDGFGVQGSTYAKDVESALSSTDGATRLRVEQALYKCYRWAIHAEAASQGIRIGSAQIANPFEWDADALRKKHAEIDDHRSRFAQAREQFGKAMDALETEIITIKSKISLYERRLDLIRHRIEGFFADEDE